MVATMVGKILSGSDSFLYSDEISTPALNELRDFLKKAKDRNIFVVGLLPPHDPRLDIALRDSVLHGEYQRQAIELITRLNALFVKFGFEFHDFGDTTALGGAANEMLDLTHGSEKVYLRLMIQMAEKSPVLKKYLDNKKLAKLLVESKDNHEVTYANEF